MRNTSETYKQIIRSGNTRNWEVIINITLDDGYTFGFNEYNIMQGSFKIETAVSGDSSFDIGSAIINKCSFALDNESDYYTNFDYYKATASVRVRLKGDSVYHRIGTFTVDEPTFVGSVVQFELLDNMWKFDKPLSEVSITYPARCDTIVSSICSYCGVSIADYNFHGHAFVIEEQPEQVMNCREMIMYIAQIGCNFCTITDQGYLSLRWYNIINHNDLDGGTFNTYTTPYSDGDVADGGDFLDYTSGDSYDGGSFAPETGVNYFTRLMSRNIGTDAITITGVKYVLGDTEYKIGEDGYVLSLQNPLVNESNVNAVLNLIWEVLEGMTIRPYDISTLPDIAPEVGDAVAISYKGDLVYSYLSSYTFTPSLCTAKLGAESPSRNLTTRYSADSLNTIAIAKKEAEKVVSDFDKTVQQMNDLAINAIGAYQDYEDVNTGGRIYYLSNQPITKSASGHCTFVDGSTVFKATGDGFFVSTQVVSGEPTNWQNGYNTQTGELVVNVLNAIGVNADWIKAGHISADLINSGTFVVGGSGFNAPNLLIKDAQNNVIGSWNTGGIIAQKGSFGQLIIDGNAIYGAFQSFEYFNERFYLSANSNYYYNTIYVCPYKDGWLEDDAFDMSFYPDTDSHFGYPLQMEILKLSGSSIVERRAREFDYWGISDDNKAMFDDYIIDHEWGANDGEFYAITYRILYPQGNPPDYVNLRIASSQVRNLYIDSEKITANFRGRINGSGTFYDFHLGNWSFDYIHDKLIYGSSEEPSVALSEGKVEVLDSYNTTYLENYRVVSDAISNGQVTDRGWLSAGEMQLGISANDNMHFYKTDIMKTESGTITYAQFSASDRDLKKDIETLDMELSRELIDKTQPRRFRYKGNNELHYGVIAQEARDVLNDLGEEEACLEFEQNDGRRNVAYNEYIPHLVNYVKELRAELDSVKAELKALKES